MTQEQLARKAYRSTYGIECDQTMAENLAKFAEEYNMAKALDEFENTPSQYITIPRPVNAAKEIALNSAVAVIGREATEITFDPTEKEEAPGTRLVKMAQTIYQWL